VWDQLERWTEGSRWKWKHEEHINLLEAKTVLSQMSHIAGEQDSEGKRIMIFSDSQVSIAALAKGRSSVRELNRVARKAAAWVLTMGWKVYLRYMRTHRNHADGPSRGQPLGVAEKEPNQVVAEEFPESMYRTSG
jgi:hypothetical protein